MSESFCPTCGEPLRVPEGLQFPFKRRVIWQGYQLALGGRETLLFWLLHDRLGDLVPFSMIIPFLWDRSHLPPSCHQIVRTYVDRIRSKLLGHEIPFKIVNIRGEGYSLLPHGHEHA
jgi:DNA-binding response OmpR family regulator